MAGPPSASDWASGSRPTPRRPPPRSPRRVACDRSRSPRRGRKRSGGGCPAASRDAAAPPRQLSPSAPSRERAAVDAEKPLQPTERRRTRSLAQRRREKDDNRDVDLPAQVAHRRRSRPAPALVAAEAEAVRIRGFEVRRTTAGLSGIPGAVEDARARRTAQASRLVSEVGVEAKEKSVEPGVERDDLRQCGHSSV